MTTAGFTDARNHLSELLDEVERTHERVEITRHGRTAAILISPDDLEALEETLEVLSHPDTMAQLAESQAARDAGDLLDSTDLARLMNQNQQDDS